MVVVVSLVLILPQSYLCWDGGVFLLSQFALELYPVLSRVGRGGGQGSSCYSVMYDIWCRADK